MDITTYMAALAAKKVFKPAFLKAFYEWFKNHREILLTPVAAWHNLLKLWNI